MPADLRSILQIEVPVIVRIAHRAMPLDDAIAMVPGAIIELPKEATEDLDVLVNNKTIGHGRAVKVGENFGVRITRIGPVRNRVAALGESADAATPAPAIAGNAQQPAAPRQQSHGERATAA
jgi:flagellar motor switch protein FliN/FliY